MGICHALLYVQRQLQFFYPEIGQFDKSGNLEQIIWKYFCYISFEFFELFPELLLSRPSAVCIKCYDRRRPTNCSGNFVSRFLIGDQLDAHFLYIIRLFQSSTRFEQTRAHHQEVNCINTAFDIGTVCKWPSGTQVEKETAYRTATYRQWLYQMLN